MKFDTTDIKELLCAGIICFFLTVFYFFFVLIVPKYVFANNLAWGVTPDGIKMNDTIHPDDLVFSGQVGAVSEMTGVHTHDVGEDSCRVTRNVDITEVDIEECTAHIRGLDYRFAAVTSIDPEFGAGDSSVFFGYSSGGLIKQADAFTDEQRASVTPIARIQAAKGQSGPGSDISDLGISDLRPITTAFEKIIMVWVHDFMGPLVKEGLIASDTGTRNIALTSGVFSDTQLKTQTVSAFANLTGLTIFHTALGNVTSTLGLLQYDNVNYDDPATGLTPMTNNTWWAAHTLMMSQDGTDRNPRFALLYSQLEYATQALAEAAEFDFGPFSDADPRWVPLTKIIVKKNDAAATDFQDTRPKSTVWGNPN